MGIGSYLFGKSSEDRACEFLQKSGFKILHRNFRSRFGEIDIIGLDESEILCFIEVKASGAKSVANGFKAEYRLTLQKYEKILKTVNFYQLKYDDKHDFELDLLVINGNNIELIRNISL